MHKILVSACLLGEKVRYDGQEKQLNSAILLQWQLEKRLLVLCPEVTGGLPVPRLPAEIQGQKVMNIAAEDVTSAFELGANKTLELCHQHSIQMAILKEGSPSCGTSQINDGSFKKQKISGQGVTVRLLRKHAVRVFSENQLDEALLYLQYLEGH
ncbi:MAG: DUF523 domain-containing protein [Mariprofundaceae bacterium]